MLALMSTVCVPFTQASCCGGHIVSHPHANGVLAVTVYSTSRFRGYSYTAGSSIMEINSIRDGNNIYINVTVVMIITKTL